MKPITAGDVIRDNILHCQVRVLNAKAPTMNHHSTAYGSIAGLVASVPANIITNADCPDPAAADEAAKITGVRERRWVKPGQTAYDLNLASARQVMQRMDWSGDDLDVIVYVTQTPTRAVPADVYSLAAALGASCPCVQVNYSCAGYVYGLWLTMSLLEGIGTAGLLVVGDATSTIADPADRATAPLFGDAGSATAVVADQFDGRDQHFIMGTDGAGAEKLCTEQCGDELDAMSWETYLKMDGAAVFNFTLKNVPPLAEAVRHYGEPDVWLLHQANGFMLDNLARKAKLGAIPRNIERFGNCSAASIPLLMASPPIPKITPLTNHIPIGPITNVAHRLKTERLRLGMLGFGAGWAWAGASIQCEPLKVCELIEA